MKIKYLVVLLAALFFVACNPKEEVNKEVPSSKEVERSSRISNSSLISNPITADEAIKPETAAKIEFEEETFDFGEIMEGEVVEHQFKFKNTGKNPLIINNAKGSCGCTVPEWPRSPIAPGETSEIKVKFNSKGKNGEQSKIVTLTANTLPNKTVIRIAGNVIPDPDKKPKEDS